MLQPLILVKILVLQAVTVWIQTFFSALSTALVTVQAATCDWSWNSEQRFLHLSHLSLRQLLRDRWSSFDLQLLHHQTHFPTSKCSLFQMFESRKSKLLPAHSGFSSLKLTAKSWETWRGGGGESGGGDTGICLIFASGKKSFIIKVTVCVCVCVPPSLLIFRIISFSPAGFGPEPAAAMKSDKRCFTANSFNSLSFVREAWIKVSTPTITCCKRTLWQWFIIRTF